MRSIAFIMILFLASGLMAQSGRIGPKPESATQTSNATAALETTVKQMFDEANSYVKTKAAEFTAKKIRYSDSLFLQTQREQKQLAAKYAALATTRENLAGEDFYYLPICRAPT